MPPQRDPREELQILHTTTKILSQIEAGQMDLVRQGGGSLSLLDRLDDKAAGILKNLEGKREERSTNPQGRRPEEEQPSIGNYPYPSPGSPGSPPASPLPAPAPGGTLPLPTPPRTPENRSQAPFQGPPPLPTGYETEEVARSSYGLLELTKGYRELSKAEQENLQALTEWVRQLGEYKNKLWASQAPPAPAPSGAPPAPAQAQPGFPAPLKGPTETPSPSGPAGGTPMGQPASSGGSPAGAGDPPPLPAPAQTSAPPPPPAPHIGALDKLAALLERIRRRWEPIVNAPDSGAAMTARGERFKERGGRSAFYGRTQAAGGRFLSAMQNPNELQSFGQMLGGAGELAGAIPGVGPAAEGILKLGQAAVTAVDKLRQWSDQLHNANMQFAEFSGAMAGVQARQQVRDIQLNTERGNRRAESAEYLAENRHELNKRLAKIEDFTAGIKNYVGGTLDKYMVKFIDLLTLGNLKDATKAEEGMTFAETVQTVAESPWPVDYHKPERFR